MFKDLNIFRFLDFKKKGIVNLALGIAALLCAIAALILFCVSRESVFTLQMIEVFRVDGTVIAMLVIGIVLGLVSIVFDFKLLKYGVYIAYLLSFGFYIVFQADYLGSVLSSIDPTEITASFVMMIVLTLLATFLQLASAILKKEENGNGKI